MRVFTWLLVVLSVGLLLAATTDTVLHGISFVRLASLWTGFVCSWLTIRDLCR